MAYTTVAGQSDYQRLSIHDNTRGSERKKKEWLLPRSAIGWLTPILWKAYSSPSFRTTELTQISAFHNESQSSLTDSLRLWQLLRGSATPGSSGLSLIRCTWSFTQGGLICASLLSTLAAVFCIVSTTVLLAGLISAVDSSGIWLSIAWIGGFALCELTACILYASSSNVSSRVASRLRAALQSMIYRKVLRLNACCELLPHQVETLVIAETAHAWRLCRRAPDLISAPLVIIFSMLATGLMLGATAVYGSFLYIFALIIQLLLARQCTALRSGAQRVFSRWREQRTNELLALSHQAKTFMMETAIVRRIKELRLAEAAPLRLAWLMQSARGMVLPAAVPAVAVGVALHRALDPSYDLPAATVFPVLALFLIHMETSLRRWGRAVQALFDARSSFIRLKVILSEDEVDTTPDEPIDRLVSLSFNNASFAWSSSFPRRGTKSRKSEAHLNRLNVCALSTTDIALSTAPCTNILTGVHLVVSKGRVVGVCGRPGSGKSALLLAVLGQLRLTAGQLCREPHVGYVGPESALIPGTVRDNVTMGAALKSQLYYRALRCTGLEHDVNRLPAGDETLVDCNRMSRAQQQRLMLARAVYAQRDLYLLDDPLNALDSVSADAIFESTILGALQGRTVIVVTNREQHLKLCDEVYVMREGRVLERGAPVDLAESGREYPQVLQSATYDEEWWPACPPGEVFAITSLSRETQSEGDNHDITGSGITTELRAVFSDCGVNWSKLLMYGVPLVCHAALSVGLLLCFWMALQEKKLSLLLTSFLIVAVVIVGLAFAYAFMYTQALMALSRRLHDTWLDRLSRATVEFLQSNSPALKNALWEHTWLLNAQMPRAVTGTILWSLFVFFEIAVLGLSSGLMCLVVIVTLVPLFVFVTRVASVGGARLWQRQHDRVNDMGQLVRSSLLARFSILAHGREDDLVALFSDKCDAAASDLVIADCVSAWLAFRLRAATSFLAILLFSGLVWITFGEKTAASAMGLSSVIVLLLSSHLTRAASCATRAKSHITTASLARDLVHRAELEDDEASMVEAESAPNLSWASDDASLALCDVWRPPELRAFTARVAVGECVGVLGPPATTIASALLRFVKPTAGCILISGTDIGDLPLCVVRSAVVVIPPRPVVFSGSLRWNLDPHGLWSDAQLWQSLDLVGLRELVSSMERKLLTPLGGSASCSLSLEDLQLLCLARAVLRDSSKIVHKVVLVEAPAGPRLLISARIVFPKCAVIVAGRGTLDVAGCSRVIHIS